MSAATMLQRLEAERKDRKLCEIRELVLDGCCATEVDGLTDEYSSLERLSMANVGLTTLDGLPALPALIELDLSGNPITSGLEALKNCPNLVDLNLSGNKLAAISSLAPLASMESLAHLELSNCDLVSVEGYRKEVFALLPHLKFLDGLDQTGVEEPNGKIFVDAVNGFKNGHPSADANEEVGEDDEEEEITEEDEQESESESEKDAIGLAALQGSKDLEDDEEDYFPGNADDDAEEDDDDDEEEDDADEDDGVNDEVANLSGSGVTGPRLGQKRVADCNEAIGVTDAKVAATEDD